MQEQFVDWVEENDYLYRDFCNMKKSLKKYLTLMLEDNPGLKENICNNFSTVLGRCDEITYDEDGVPEAYIILHFLDRYHRFQLMLLEMFRNETFPVKNKIRVMDIGTGPGPSLYAVSDMIALYQQYEAEVYGKSRIEVVEMDYVEQSHGFRDFLHYMTELLMDDRKQMYVPFHQGAYRDASELYFSGEIERESFIWNQGEYIYYDKQVKKVPKSFDLVIYSNFLTNMDVLDRFGEQLKRAAFYLKNKGIILIVGGNPEDRKYAPVYHKIDEIILEQNYQSRKFWGTCRKLGEIQEMRYSDNDRYGKQIKEFYSEELDVLTDGDWEDRLEKKFQKLMRMFIDGDTQTKWHYEIYERRSKYRVEK